MKKSNQYATKTKKTPKINKGGPSGLVISLIVHAAAFFVAGLFVVFTVLPKAEPAFEAPSPVERPKMKLKKPKVKIKKSSQPKPSSRIVAKVKTAKMPEIQIPDLVGSGDGLLSGLGDAGGDLIDLPDIGEVTVFGGNTSIGNDMAVSYYNLNLLRSGNAGSMSPGGFETVISDFIQSGFDKSILRKYYRSPRKLYATTIMIPLAVSTIAPASFNEDLNYSYCWAALFEGKLVHKDGITFRFWGASDDVLAVEVDGELVLNASFVANGTNPYAPWWSSPAPFSLQLLGNQYRRGSDWITLEPGVPLDFKAIVGESPGGQFAAQLLVEVDGKEYELNDQGSPIYEVFAMDEISWELKDSIMLTLQEGEANVTNVTTIFRDY
jgi:hypothetical protein